MILAPGRGLAHALGGRSGRVVQVQRSWGVPGNLDAQQFDGGPASKIDVGKAAAGARGRERIESSSIGSKVRCSKQVPGL